MVNDGLVNAYVSFFEAKKSALEATNTDFKITDEYISNSIDEIENILGSNSKLTDEERNLVVNRIKTINTIHQDEGSVILGDYEHDYQWYERLLASEDHEEYFWLRYRNHLLNDKHLPEAIVKTLENDTLRKIMSYLGDPNDKSSHFSIRGLVVGDVQSGKTSNYIGLATKAADSGYKVIFILTGTIESLRKQTQQRVEEGFIGYNPVTGEDVGVKRGDKNPMSFTSRSKDFTGNDDQNTTYRISNYSTEPLIFILKKNKSVLQKVYASLKTINTSNERQKIDFPILVIDDEADNASINTNKLDGEHDPTAINKYIRQILALFTRSSYVGFTATPFANVFISYDDEKEMEQDDLFPKDFIYALEAPSNYCGARKYFFEKNPNVKFIKDDNQLIFPIDHKKDWNGTTLYKSVFESVNCFLLSNVIRDIRDPIKNTHRSMLINMSRFTDVQLNMKEIIKTYVEDTVRNVKQSYKTLDPLENSYVLSLKNTFDKEYGKIYFAGKKLTWEMVLEKFYESTKNIKTVVVNSSKNSEKLNYDEHKEGLRVIAIGGLALSRGLTLEGLCCSYFYRNTSTYDVLMQMGRWFGYRGGYEDIIRIFMTKTTHDYYKEICLAIEQLKKDIKRMGLADKKPLDYGIRVRNSEELSITAKNKMRNTSLKVDHHSFYGCLYETPYLHADFNIMNENIDNTLWFMNQLDFSKKDNSVTYPYFRDVEKEKITDLLSKLIVHDANSDFDTKQLCRFLNNHPEIDKFDVLFMGGSGSHMSFESMYGDCLEYDTVGRFFDLRNNGSLVRMSGIRAHIWGPSDPSYGLTKEEIKEVKENTSTNPSAKMYLNKHNQPLFIVYFITPNTNSSDCDTTSPEGSYRKRLSENKYKQIVGFAIGFPEKDGQTGSSTLYTVNNKVNYYDKMHEEDNEQTEEL